MRAVAGAAAPDVFDPQLKFWFAVISY